MHIRENSEDDFLYFSMLYGCITCMMSIQYVSYSYLSTIFKDVNFPVNTCMCEKLENSFKVPIFKTTNDRDGRFVRTPEHHVHRRKLF